MPVEPGTVNAPDFPAGAEWLNTDRPLSIQALKGKIVLLDFWTYCCINCQHVLPDLKRLERKYADFLVVIGVHSGKFLAEKDAGNIRQAILRHDIEHPVVNDPEMKIWSEYAVRAWPTMMLFDPRGKVIGSHSGEGVFEVFDPVIAQMAEHFEAEGALDYLSGAHARGAVGADLLLTDVYLKGELSGRDLLAHVRGPLALGKRALPVLVMTGDGNREKQSELLREGANDLVLKPIEERLLVTKVLFQLRVSRMPEQRDFAG